MITKFINEYFNTENLKLSAKLTPVLTLLFAIMDSLINFYQPVLDLLFWLGISVVVDILTGIIKNRKDFSSWSLIKRKPMVLFLWGLGLTSFLLCDKFLAELNITGNWAAKAYCIFYGLYETVSITENLAGCGLKGPAIILKMVKGKLPDEYVQAIEQAEKKD